MPLPATGSTEASRERHYRIPTLREAVLSPRQRPVLFAVTWFGLAVALGATLFAVRYSLLIYQRLREGPFSTSSAVYAAPRAISTGAEISQSELVAYLQRSGYSETANDPTGYYAQRAGELDIHPGIGSYFRQEPVTVSFSKDRVAKIVSLRDKRPHPRLLIEPELISNLAGKNRQRRRPVSYSELPPVLIQAVTSAEDKRFFEHTGFDLLRILKAAYVDVRNMSKDQGASTLSMQLARMIFLDQDKKWSRKIAEAFITLHLELRLSKEEIFEHYANHIYLGRRGSFSIHGFGEGARAYLGKDVRQIDLPEAAMLAGIIQRPSYFNPFRWPDRMKKRRDIILGLMQQNGYITPEQCRAAMEAPLELAGVSGESTDAPYFVDLVNHELQSRFDDFDFHGISHRIYTTLDLDLQRDAHVAVKRGMDQVDALLARRAKARKEAPGPQAQVALVALDAKTGELKALVGGRDYGESQLNRALAMRQPGSVFKPFVYAAALSGPLKKDGPPVTPATVLEDTPAEFQFHGQVYKPSNFGDEYYGPVTVRRALAKSLNIPTVRLAEMVGYDDVAALAKAAGMNSGVEATPAVALGAYDATPIEVAGAYTAFSRMGAAVTPVWIQGIRDGANQVLHQHQPSERQVLDPRVAYMLIDLMQEVMRSGTAAGARARGFTLPAAGKTGTSRDGWFAGFTSELICVVWVGFDDGRELGLEGARSALPVWTEFMKLAHGRPEYRDATSFEAPKGLERAEIDIESGQLATPACYETRSELFLPGTAPANYCELHLGSSPEEPGGLAPPPANLWDRLKGVFR
jgi:penicillin-binding protein 1B